VSNVPYVVGKITEAVLYGIAALIGLYFAFRKRPQKQADGSESAPSGREVQDESAAPELVRTGRAANGLPRSWKAAVVRVYCRFQHGSAALQSPFLLLVRIYWGFQFAQSGWGRLHHLGNATQFFSSLGLPAPGPTVVFISLLEFAGGILLILGLGTRLTGLLLAGDMVGAYALADREAFTSILTDPGKFYGADPYTFLFASLLVLIFGAGKFSLDYWFWRRREA
jgi:putative oxidoreductase